ncbi:MAG: hypothetical protein J6Y94_01440, partial [Bacteriovoracaceae bacterium]|nr:hypothetical protein [Bacteriovoracaceae bacterium]
MDYERIKNAIEKSRGVGNQWTSYSDLFMSLAIVFLLLYVMLGLRSTGQEVAYHQMVQKAQEEVSQTREQMAAYASVGDDYLAQNSNAEENEVYAKVFQQLSLLEDQEKAYKERLKELSEQAADKENELSQYQKIIKNIVQANLLAKSKMQKQQQDLVAQEELVENLQENLRENQQQLQENTRQIASIEEARIGQQKELEKVLAQRKEDQSKHTQQIQAYTKEVAALEEQAAAYQAKLQKTQQEMAQQHQAAQNKYKALQDKLTAAQGVAQQERQNAEKVLAATARQKKGFEADLTRLRQQHQAALEAERAKIAQLDQEKLSAQ